MSQNYIKIELENSGNSKTVPLITMKYESIESFQNLIFFLLSDSGSVLFTKTIEQELIEKNRLNELEILRAFSEILITSKNKHLLIRQNEHPVKKPSSFNRGKT